MPSADHARSRFSTLSDLRGPVVYAALGLFGVGLVTAASFHLRPIATFATTALVYLLIVVALSLTGSFFSAALVSVVGVFTLDYLFSDDTPGATEARDAIALLVFLTTALVITTLVAGMRNALGRIQASMQERSRAEEQLRESERRYRNIFQTSPAAVYEQDFSVVDAQIDDLRRQGVTDVRRHLAEHPELVETALGARILDMNAAASRLFEASRDELQADPRAIVTPELTASFAAALAAAAEGHTHFEAETEVRTLKGARRAVLLAMTFGTPGNMKSVLTRMIDITARREAEEALHRAQAELAHVTRVVMLGELAASIAHEINQPLAAIVADAHACLNWLNSEHPDLTRVREALRAMVQDTHRASEVVTRTRRLLTRSSLPYEPCDLRDVIRDAVSLVQSELMRHGITVRTSLAPRLPLVLGDRIQLGQVLVNLLMNAADASKEVPPQRRRLLVVATAERSEGSVSAAIAVQDQGTGLVETGPRLFEPFYTTKPGGMGMGLSISRSIIEQHGGRLRAHANPDYGATFRFALPGLP